MDLNKVAAEITRREGGRVSLPVGQVKEVLRIICRMAFEQPKLLMAMFLNGERQCKRGKRR